MPPVRDVDLSLLKPVFWEMECSKRSQANPAGSNSFPLPWEAQRCEHAPLRHNQPLGQHFYACIELKNPRIQCCEVVRQTFQSHLPRCKNPTGVIRRAQKTQVDLRSFFLQI